MGASWRIGVDASERTELVTSGVFAYVRNSTFSAMILAQTGMLLMVPSWVSAAALLALVVLQVRAVEEPYLHAVHGESYARYAARAGRFVPRVGRTVGAAEAGAR